MSVAAEKKQEIISNYRRGENDTGSPEVQVAILTERIENLTAHLKEHKKDLSCRRGLLGMVAQRRKLLDYLKRHNPDGYSDLIKSLNIRR